MKNYLTLALASVLSVGSFAAASAADLPMKAPPMAPVVVSNFTGCYIDGGAGYNVWNNDHSTTGPIGAATITGQSTTDGGRGWYGRFGGGCDYQLSGGLSNWVIGAFGDYDFMDAPGNNQPSEILPIGGITQPLNARMKMTDAYYAGARLG